MFYRITLDMMFADEDPANDILDKALDAKDLAQIINPGTPDQELPFITLEKCYHDEHPNLPCERLFHWTPSPPE